MADSILWAWQWEESERGWGVRPDGASLHISEDEARAYLKKHWEEENKRNKGSVPDEYSRPNSDDPFRVVVTEEAYKRVQAEKSVRLNTRDEINKNVVRRV